MVDFTEPYFDSNQGILARKGVAVNSLADAKKREHRDAKDGVVHAYIHPGSKLGVLVEVNCETDFVARGEEFQQLVKDVAMHIAAAEPRYVSRDEISSVTLDKERDIARAQAKNDPKNANKPEQVIEKIVERMKKINPNKLPKPRPNGRPYAETRGSDPDGNYFDISEHGFENVVPLGEKKPN